MLRHWLKACKVNQTLHAWTCFCTSVASIPACVSLHLPVAYSAGLASCFSSQPAWLPLAHRKGLASCFFSWPARLPCFLLFLVLTFLCILEYVVCKYFLPVSNSQFYPCNSILHKAKFFNLSEIQFTHFFLFCTTLLVLWLFVYLCFPNNSPYLHVFLKKIYSLTFCVEAHDPLLYTMFSLRFI